MTLMWTLDYSEDSEDKSSCGCRERWYLLPTLHVSPHPPTSPSPPTHTQCRTLLSLLRTDCLGKDCHQKREEDGSNAHHYLQR